MNHVSTLRRATQAFLLQVCAKPVAFYEVQYITKIYQNKDYQCPLIFPEQFASAASEKKPLLELNQSVQSVLIVYAASRYVAVHLWRDVSIATIYDGLNPKGYLRTTAGQKAAEMLSEVYLRTTGKHLKLVTDGNCVTQHDTSTCALHAVRNAERRRRGMFPDGYTDCRKETTHQLARMAIHLQNIRRGNPKGSTDNPYVRQPSTTSEKISPLVTSCGRSLSKTATQLKGYRFKRPCSVADLPQSEGSSWTTKGKRNRAERANKLRACTGTRNTDDSELPTLRELMDGIKRCWRHAFKLCTCNW